MRTRRLDDDLAERRALARVDAKVAAAVAEAPPLPDEVAELWGRLIGGATRPADARRVQHAPAS